MSYIPDSGPDDGTTRRTFIDRRDAIVKEWVPVDGLVEFGAYNGRLARELAEAHSIPGIAIDNYEGLVGDARVKAVNKTVTPRELGKLIRELDGDKAVLALSILHHLPDWEKYLGVIERGAKVAYIETANPDEVLPEAIAHSESAKILKAVEKIGTPIHESPGWDSRFNRTLWKVTY